MDEPAKQGGRLMRLPSIALAGALLLSQCEGQCDDPAGTDGPQMTQYQAAEGVVICDCDSYVPLFEAYGLPSSTFRAIAWRESGCNHTSWVNDADDLGGGLLGINFRTQTLRNGWYSWCGATVNNFRYDPNL